MRDTRIQTLAGALGALALIAAAPFAAASSLSVTYYDVASSDPDFNTQNCCDIVSDNEVLSSLGPDGLPLYNATGYSDDLGTSGPPSPLQDVNSNGDITWWSPGSNSNVSQTGTGTAILPYSNGSLFPPNGTGGSDGGGAGFLTAVFTGTLDVGSTEAVQFSVGADDVAFVYLDGSIVCDLGGVHPLAEGTCTTPTVSAGTHTIDLFYADVHQVAAQLDFSILTPDVTSTAVPEPTTLALLSCGLIGLAVTRRRRRS